MDEFAQELSELDDTQERVEAVSDELLKALDEDDADCARVRNMVDEWIDALRKSDFQAERIAYLYVANHVLQKTLFDPEFATAERAAKTPRIVGFFQIHLVEAVSLVSNSPMDRQSVVRLLELWHEKAIFPDAEILKMWHSTGEDLPGFLLEAQRESAALLESISSSAGASHGSGGGGVNSNGDSMEDIENELRHAPPPALPKLNAHAANPVLDVLKKIDHHKAAIQFLEQSIRRDHQFMLTQGVQRYDTPEDVLNDYATSPSMLKDRVEKALRLVKIRNKYIEQIPAMKEELRAAIKLMVHAEREAATKNDLRLEQCDMIDIGLTDLSDHRDAYPSEWSREAYASAERRRRQEEEQRAREAEIARLHQIALLESASHAKSLEADITGRSGSGLQSLAKNLDARRDKEQKAEQANEMVWHPVLRELVPLQSLNVEWESWRDH